MPVRFYGWGEETTFTGPKSSQEAGIGIIHQELNLIPQLTIAETVSLGREFVNRFGKIDWKTMYAEADKLLAKLNLRFKATSWWAIFPSVTSKWLKSPKC